MIILNSNYMKIVQVKMLLCGPEHFIVGINLQVLPGIICGLYQPRLAEEFPAEQRTVVAKDTKELVLQTLDVFFSRYTSLDLQLIYCEINFLIE